jgi:hypothetical protein
MIWNQQGKQQDTGGAGGGGAARGGAAGGEAAGRATTPPGQRVPNAVLITFASGYSRYHGSDEEEIQASEYREQHGTFDPENPDQNWWPRAPDFRAAAEQSSSGARVQGVATPAALIRAIQSAGRGRRRLTEVRWYGHGARAEVQFGSGGVLSIENIAMIPDLSSHFTSDGKIVFYACNVQHQRVGVEDSLLRAIANRARVSVCGFGTGVRYNLQWEGESPSRRITRRGLHPSWASTPICFAPQ